MAVVAPFPTGPCTGFRSIHRSVIGHHINSLVWTFKRAGNPMIVKISRHRARQDVADALCGYVDLFAFAQVRSTIDGLHRQEMRAGLMDLHTFTEERFIAEAELIEVFRQLLECLLVLQRHDIVHRDIKRENIVLFQLDDGSCAFRLIDWDFAIPANESPRGLQGTTALLAPEIRADRTGRKPLHVSSDTYSLGVTIQEMMTHANQFCWGYYDHLWDLTERMTRQCPESRPTAATLLEDPIFKKGTSIML